MNAMYLTKDEDKQITETADALTVILSRTGSPIEREYLQETRNRLITISLAPVKGE